MSGVSMNPSQMSQLNTLLGPREPVQDPIPTLPQILHDREQVENNDKKEVQSAQGLESTNPESGGKHEGQQASSSGFNY